MLPSTPLNDRIGFALSRIVVPLWIFAGVAFKLHSGSASNLPSNIVNFVRDFGPGAMDATLYTLIGLEIFAILVMVGIARLARPMAMFMLIVFCLILVGEMLKGAEKCGCFGGSVPVEPWHMLIADGVLLLGVILFRPPTSSGPALTPGTIAASAAALVAGLAASFGIGHLLHGGDEPEPPVRTPEVIMGDQPADPYVNPARASVPRNWFPQNLSSWIGRPWREIEVFQFMPRWPEGLDEGTHYVVFYSRTCTHCEDMFYDDFTRPLAAPLVAIQIPASRTELTGNAPNVWPLPEDLDSGVTLTSLPLGPDWSLMTAPLSLRIENGIVTCAEEGDHRQCMELE